MKVFFTVPIAKRDWYDGLASEQGQPLQAWFPAARAAYEAAGCPSGQVRIRHRVVACNAGDHDGFRNIASSTGMVLEVGVV